MYSTDLSKAGGSFSQPPLLMALDIFFSPFCRRSATDISAITRNRYQLLLCFPVQWGRSLIFRADISAKTASTSHLLERSGKHSRNTKWTATSTQGQTLRCILCLGFRFVFAVRDYLCVEDSGVNNCQIHALYAPSLRLWFQVFKRLKRTKTPSRWRAHQRRSRANFARMEVKTPGPSRLSQWVS